MFINKINSNNIMYARSCLDDIRKMETILQEFQIQSQSPFAKQDTYPIQEDKSDRIPWYKLKRDDNGDFYRHFFEDKQIQAPGIINYKNK